MCRAGTSPLVHQHLEPGESGGLALALYRRHPHIPGRLILASAYASWVGSLSADEVEARLQRGLRDAQWSQQEWVEDYLPTCFAHAVSPELVDATAAMILDTRSAGGAGPDVRSFAVADLRDILPTIAVPALLLYGESDVRAPRPVAGDLPTVSATRVRTGPHGRRSRSSRRAPAW